MWHRLAPTELDFVDRSPFQLVNDIVVFAPAERVFDVLTSERDMYEWLDALAEVRYTSEAPHRVGSTREVVIDLLQRTPRQQGPGALAVKERILAWDRGKRFAFALDQMTIPLVSQMVEDMQLERLGPGRTMLRYRVHYRPNVLMRAVHPVARTVFDKMFRDAARRVAMVAARGGTTASVL